MPALSDCGVFRAQARQDVDILVVRENRSGAYFGEGSRYSSSRGERQAKYSFSYSEPEIRRVIETGVRLASQRRQRICLVSKPYGIPVISDLWTEIFTESVADRGLAARVLEVDNASYQLLAAAQEFDVVVAPNLFGDILGDEAALLLGSRGLSYSANFGAPGSAVYQTGHGAAHDLAGKDLANPIGQILSAALMLRESFGLDEAASLIETAIETTVAAGIRTRDIAVATSQVVGTRALGEHIAAVIRSGSTRAPARSAVPVACVDHHWIAGGGHAQFERRNPSNWAETLACVPFGSSSEVARAVASSAQAQQSWQHTTAAERAALLQSWANRLTDQAEELTELLAVEVGKPRSDAAEEIHRAAAMIRTSARLFRTEQVRSLDGTGQILVRCRPHGVVAIITPWNNPIAIPAGKIAAALALANSVIWKPAIEAPRTALAVMETVAAAGIPAGVVNMVFGDAQTANALIDDPLVAAVAMTGSIRAGRSAAVRCAERGKPFQGELGGNNAAIVLGDCDLDASMRGMALAAFSYSGQRCTAIRRFIVERAIAAQFTARLVAAVRSLRLGDPHDSETEIGPLVSRCHRDAVLGRIQQAAAGGARLLCGGDIPPGWENGCWLAPTLLDNVAIDSPIVQEESFGPVAVVLEAEDLEHAIALANGVEQGLVAALYGGNDAQRRRFAEAIEAGIARLSAGPLLVHPEAPFGGWKASGFGPPEHGEWDAQFYARPQALCGWPEAA